MNIIFTINTTKVLAELSHKEIFESQSKRKDAYVKFAEWWKDNWE